MQTPSDVRGTWVRWTRFERHRPFDGMDVIVVDTYGGRHRGCVLEAADRHYIDCRFYGLRREDVVWWMLTPEAPDADV